MGVQRNTTPLETMMETMSMKGSRTTPKINAAKGSMISTDSRLGSRTMQGAPIDTLEQQHTPWKLKAQQRISNSVEQEIKDYLAVLRRVEDEVAELDRYVEHCIIKYKPFMFNIQVFLTDELIGSAKFVERLEVTAGQYKGHLFWGQHLDIDQKFEPHGFGILVDEKNKILQLGTFKQGKEFGQQRIIQSYPLKSRYFTQFTSQQGVLHGPALIERADGRVEIGTYKRDRQDGVWRYRLIDGSTETKTFAKGKAVNNN